MRRSAGYGTGYVFQRTYKDRHDRQRKTKVFYIAYPLNGVEQRESTGKTKYTEALGVLKERLAGVNLPKPGDPFTIESLIKLIEDDYKVNGLNSVDTLQASRFPHLRAYFGTRDLSNLKKTDIQAYRTHRLHETIKKGRNKGQRYSGATINREVATLGRGLKLAHEQELITTLPPIKKTRETGIRKGFFERETFQEILKHVDEWWHELYEVAYITGWRLDSEICPLTWAQVDFANGLLRLEPGTTKNKEGRNFPLTPNLRAALERQRERVRALEIKTERVIKWVFPRRRSNRRKIREPYLPLTTAYKPFKVAAVAAGFDDRIPHDFRRTAIRNLELAGIQRKTAMAMVGHKTESVYQRYNILDHRQMELGAQQLAAFEAKQVK